MQQLNNDLTKLKPGDQLNLGGQYGTYTLSPSGQFIPFNQPNSNLPLSSDQVKNIGSNFS